MRSIYFVLTSILLALTQVYADDVEIYTGNTTGVGDPNVVLIFDTSGSMGERDAADENGNLSTRLKVSKDAAISIIGSLKDVNIGLVRFDYTGSERDPFSDRYVYTDSSRTSTTWYDHGGFIQVPVGSINDANHKNTLIHAIQNLPANANTPLLETYDETARYFRGEAVKYGKKHAAISCSPEDKVVQVDGYWETERVCVEKEMARQCVKWRWWGCSEWGELYETGRCLREEIRNTNYVDAYEYTETTMNCSKSNYYQDFYLSHPSTYDASGNYISPIGDTCQSNHIIVFTDGASTRDTDSDFRVRNLLRNYNGDKSATYISESCTTSGSDSCLEEMALILKNTDTIDDSKIPLDDNPSDDGEQTIFTYTIGGFFDDTNAANKRLQNMAEAGGGIYKKVDKDQGYKGVQDALINTFDEIQTKSSNFSSPSVAVNALNRLENSEELYYTVFSPNNSIGWEGNLKRYRLGSNGKIYDATDTRAVNSSTGFFDKNSTSFWTLSEDAPDGDVVNKGGAARRLTLNRKVITHLGGNNTAITDRLLNTDNSLNTAMTPELFGVSGSSDESFSALVHWGAGQKATSSGFLPRRAIEDPLHSKPAVIHYGIESDGKTLDSTIYFGTNSGYLHAIDSDINDPQERFAFIPKELLPNISKYKNNPNTLGKVYGLDGPISTLFIESGENDLATVIDSDDKAYLYIGMRRGGKNYYALDVSDRDNPKYLWKISGGSGDFLELGETWSEMTPINIDPKTIGISNGEKTIKVLVFGGGYDNKEDNTNSPTSSRIDHDKGNAIFIVDAITGKLLWKASPNPGANLRLSNMKNAIVGNITPVDNDGDGNIDILYAADTGGRIWRIDLHSDGSQTGLLLADLNDGSAKGNVRFFNSPDVSYITDAGNDGSYLIGIGSGYRAHPLNTVSDDHYYVIYDYLIQEDISELKSAIAAYSFMAKNDLADFANYSSESEIHKENGFFFKLPGKGEKALSNSLTTDYKIYFTTYRPSSSTSTSLSCSGSSGHARAYTIDLKFARPGYNNDGDGSGGSHPHSDKDSIDINYRDLQQSTIPSSPVLVFPPAKEPEKRDKEEDDINSCPSPKTILVGGESIKTDDCPSLDKHYWHEV